MFCQMDIRRKLLLGSLLFSSLAFGLYLLPRSVVSKEENRIKPAEAKVSTDVQQDASPEVPHQIDPGLQKELTEIQDALKKSSLAPEKADLSQKLAKVYLKGNRFDSAGIWFEKAMSADPSLHLEFEAGAAYFEALPFIASASKLEAGAEKVRKLMNKVPSSDARFAEAQARAALTWVNTPSPMKGILKLRELANEYPENVFIAYQMGLLSFQSGQFEKATERFRKVLELEKENVNAMFYLSSSLFQTGKKAEARVEAEKGLKLTKDEQTKASFQDIIHQTEK